jgi:hypothetical protein
MTLIELISMVSTGLGGSVVNAYPATSKLGQAAYDNYANMARVLLRAFPFPEATEYVTLSYQPGSPENLTNFYYQYRAPSNILKPLDINHDEDADFRYAHGLIYTDYEDPVLRYTADIAYIYEPDGETIDYIGELEYSDTLARAIVWRLAKEIASGNAPKMHNMADRSSTQAYYEAIMAGGGESREKYDKPKLWTDV